MPAPPSGPPDEGVVADLYGYAALVTLDPAIAADAVRDAVVVVGRVVPLQERRVLLALTRNESLRQLRARQRFVDVRGDVDLRGLPAGSTGDELWRRALAGLSPGERDALALTYRCDLAADDTAAVMRVGTREATARVRGAESAWATVATAVSAVVATADEPPPCPDVVGILTRQGPAAAERAIARSPAPAQGAGQSARSSAQSTDEADDAVVTLPPALVARVARHVERCETCRERRRSDLGTSPVGELLRDADPAPADLAERALWRLHDDAARAERIVSRAGTFDADGFPEALDADDRAPGVWARRALVLAAASAVLLLVAMLVSVTVR